MDRLEQFVHLVLVALSKARELSTIALEPESKKKVAQITKDVNRMHKKMQRLEQGSHNGKGLDDAAMAAELDELIEIMQDVNKKLDHLLAKAKGQE